MIFDGERGQLVRAVLRPGNAHAARGAMGSPTTDYSSPQAALSARANCGARRFRLCCPARAADAGRLRAGTRGDRLVFGLAQNPVLLRFGAAALSGARLRFQATKQTVQHFDAFAYAAETWPQARHVIMKAEVSEHGANPRFVVTSLPEFAPALLYHGVLCAGTVREFYKRLQKRAASRSPLVFHVCRQLLSLTRTRCRLCALPRAADPGAHHWRPSWGGRNSIRCGCNS